MDVFYTDETNNSINELGVVIHIIPRNSDSVIDLKYINDQYCKWISPQPEIKSISEI